MAYIITDNCLQCGVCVPKCPEGAIIPGEQIVESDGFVLQPVSIDPAKCTECGVCVSEEYWCPGEAIAAP
jgi:NAD-dependent dihydropyrimidine dehydrogenase PreA subunit